MHEKHVAKNGFHPNTKGKDIERQYLNIGNTALLLAPYECHIPALKISGMESPFAGMFVGGREIQRREILSFGKDKKRGGKYQDQVALVMAFKWKLPSAFGTWSAISLV